MTQIEYNKDTFQYMKSIKMFQTYERIDNNNTSI